MQILKTLTHNINRGNPALRVQISCVLGCASLLFSSAYALCEANDSFSSGDKGEKFQLGETTMSNQNATLKAMGFPEVNIELDAKARANAGEVSRLPDNGTKNPEKQNQTDCSTKQKTENPSKDSYWGNSNLIMFGDTNHSDPTPRLVFAKRFAELKEHGTKYVAFEGVPQDFTNESLKDRAKIDELKKSLGPLDVDSTIEMLKSADAAGLKIVGLEKSMLNGSDIISQLHGVLQDKIGKKAFADYANDDTAHKDSERGKALQTAIESELQKSNKNWSPDKLRDEAAKTIDELDMMKDSHADFKTLSKEADSLLAREELGREMAEQVLDPAVLSAYTNYLSAKIAARDSAAPGSIGKYPRTEMEKDGGARKDRMDDTSAKALAAFKNALSTHMNPKDVDNAIKEIDSAVVIGADKAPVSKDIMENVSKFLSDSMGTDEAKEVIDTISRLADGPSKNTLVYTLTSTASAFALKYTFVAEMDWRNRVFADKLSETMEKGKTAVFSGTAHLMDNEYGKGRADDPTDEFGFIPKTILHYLREESGDSKVGHPWLWLNGRRVDPSDDSAVQAAERSRVPTNRH